MSGRDSPNVPDVVVVGGGVVGCATAYFLARDGYSVTLIERDSIASHASGFAYGGLSPILGIIEDDPLLAPSHAADASHVELARRLPGGSGAEDEHRRKTLLPARTPPQPGNRFPRTLAGSPAPPATRRTGSRRPSSTCSEMHRAFGGRAVSRPGSGPSPQTSAERIAGSRSSTPARLWSPTRLTPGRRARRTASNARRWAAESPTASQHYPPGKWRSSSLWFAVG